MNRENKQRRRQRRWENIGRKERGGGVARREDRGEKKEGEKERKAPQAPDEGRGDVIAATGPVVEPSDRWTRRDKRRAARAQQSPHLMSVRHGGHSLGGPGCHSLCKAVVSDSVLG